MSIAFDVRGGRITALRTFCGCSAPIARVPSTARYRSPAAATGPSGVRVKV